MRLFFALWPDDDVRKQINKNKNRAAKLHRGVAMQAANLHLTLAFLGNVSEEQYDCVINSANAIPFTPFDISLKNIGIFSRAKVLWLGLEEKPDVLLQLATLLQQSAVDCGIQLDKKTFNPHVTLMRKVQRMHPMKVDPIHWHIDRFCLVQSSNHPEGVQYKVMKTWE